MNTILGHSKNIAKNMYDLRISYKSIINAFMRLIINILTAHHSSHDNNPVISTPK